MYPQKIFRKKYILASKSKRRIKLLKQIGLNFVSIDSRVKELEEENHNPVYLVKHNSENKARKVAEKFKNEIIIAADTIVVLKGKIINKPSDKKEAIAFLKLLNGNKHIVYTGIFLINLQNNKTIFEYEKTDVYFRKLDLNEIKFYVDKYKPLDKAGAYGIQDDFGCLFIRKINGDYYNVVGLPLVKFYLCLKKII